MPLQQLIDCVESDLAHARAMYQRASVRGDITGMFTWGQETRQTVQRLEEIGALEDDGRTAFAIARA